MIPRRRPDGDSLGAIGRARLFHDVLGVAADYTEECGFFSVSSAVYH